jgi:hypothetical protein
MGAEIRDLGFGIGKSAIGEEEAGVAEGSAFLAESPISNP